MTAFDFKKDRKDLYQPTIAPAIVDVPDMLFIMIDGRGDPNTSKAYAEAMETLYGLSYAIRMNKAETDYFEYVVPPSEGFWDIADPKAMSENGSITDKNQLIWALLIRQPDFVTQEVFEKAKVKLAKRKPTLHPGLARLERYTEGLCIQALHLGPYADEPATIKAMEGYQQQRGFRLDYTNGRRHHEIYLSNPKTTQPEAMKTILRHPIKRR